MALVHKQEYAIAKAVVGLVILGIVGGWVYWFTVDPAIAILIPIGLGIGVGLLGLLMLVLWLADVFQEESKRKRRERNGIN